jgi:hypothetical protein
MFVLGLIILAAVVVGTVELVLANRSEITFKMWDQTWQLDAFWLAVMGAVLLLATVIALSLMRASMARHRRLRTERRSLAEENRMLAERAGTSYPAAPSAPADTMVRTQDQTDAAAQPQHQGFFARHSMAGRRHSHST